MNAERTCDLCGATAFKWLFDVGGFPVAECASCGLVFALDPPNADELIELYDQSYYEQPASAGYGGYGEAEERKRHHARGLLEEIERVTDPGKLVEIGCAYGFFLDEARRRGWGVRGVEPSEHAALRAREQFGLDVTTTPFTELPVEPGSLDAVAMWDVIEHLPNPRATLAAAADWVRPGGAIAISTGDIGSMAARLHGREWSLMTPPWHQFYFSRATLRRMLRETGFEPCRVYGDGLFAVDPSSGRPRVPGVVASLLTRSLTIRIARRLGAGSIMFAFARRTGS